MYIPRFVPAAATPIGFIDILVAVYFSAKGQGSHMFREQIARYLHKKKVYTFASLMRTTYACLVGLRTKDKRTEVVLPRYSCPSFAHGILAAGLTIRHIDLDPDTLAIRMKDLRSLNPKKTLAILVPHFFGYVHPIDEIKKFTKRNNIYLIEGADYAFGTDYKKKPLGSFGDFTILNFQEGKAIPIGGGAVVTNDKCMNMFSDDTRKPTPSRIFIMTAYSIFIHPFMYFLFQWIVTHTSLKRKGFSMEDTIRETHKEFDYYFDPKKPLYRISNFQGALGLRVLEKLNKVRAIRNKNAEKIARLVQYHKCFSLFSENSKVTQKHYIRFPLLIKRGLRKSVLKLFLQHGIEASPMYAEHGMKIQAGKFSGSKRIADDLITLPCHPYVNEKDIQKMTDIIQLLS